MQTSAGSADSPSVSAAEFFDVIYGASSQDPVQLQASAKRLKALLEVPGAFSALHAIACKRDLPLTVRQQSIIQFKNSAVNHWRSRKFLTDEQRGRIRTCSIELLDEEDPVISACNAAIVSKIARQDYPHNWGSLIMDITGVIQTNLEARFLSSAVDPKSSLLLRNSLKVLHGILKEFSIVRMLTGVKTMAQLVTQLHAPLSQYYSQISQAIVELNPVTISQPFTAENLVYAHLIMKCLVTLCTWGWSRAEQTEEIKSWAINLFRSSVSQLQTLNESRINLVVALRGSPSVDPVTAGAVDQLTRHIKVFGKFFRRLQQLSVAKFVALPDGDVVVLYYWNKVVQAANSPADMIADSNGAVFPVRFLVQAMVLFKESLAQWAPLRKGEKNSNVLSQEFVGDAVRLLVTRFLPLSPGDLENWKADPEEWVINDERENEQWEFGLRPCSERVLMTLCNQYKDYVVPLLLSTFNQVVGQPATDLASIVQKEAVYCAIGRCAARLKDVIPFDQWLDHSLAAEAQFSSPDSYILKRRIAWLIGKWIGDMCAPPNNPKIWEVLLHLLCDRGPGTDAVVQLTAAIALRECVKAIGFDIELFSPYLVKAVTELVRIMGEATALESKRRISSTLNAIVEHAGVKIVPLVGIIVEPLPEFWSEAEKDYSLKISILATVTKLVEAAREHSVTLSRVVVPLVRESLSPQDISSLDDSALSLLCAALCNTITIHAADGAPGLIELFPALVHLLSENADLLGRIVAIHQSYYILDASAILHGFAVDLFRAYSKALGNSPLSINIADMLRSVNMLVQLAPSSLWGEPLHVSGLFAYLLKTLTEEKLGTALLVELVYIFARMAMMDSQMFMQLMSATAVAQGVPEKMLYNDLLDQWWTKFDNMSEPRHRKLTAMGLAALLATGRAEVLARLPNEMFNMWLDVFGEIKEMQETRDDASLSLKRYWDTGPPESYFMGTKGSPEYDRRTQMYERDPVHTTALAGYVRARLAEAEGAAGGAAFGAALAAADPLVLQQVQAEVMR